MDIYTAMLVIALVAIILATIFAYLETADYGDNKFQGAPSVVQTPSLQPPSRLLVRTAPFAPEITRNRLV
ncbi:MAG TPA: hypothetical protein DD670_04950 [Planctomycetaceae bacterium]|nr:hypothetical protein [Planctomycetaceae bacterium]